MKRSPLARSAKPIRKRNSARQQRRKEHDEVYGSYWRWVTRLPCMLIGFRRCFGLNTAHHLKSVGSGGKDAENLIPLCQGAHTEIHTIGLRAFDAKYGVDAMAHAADVWRTYLDSTSEGET